jgi:hypothetical protein
LEVGSFRVIVDVPTVPTLRETCRINLIFALPRSITFTSTEYPNGPGVGKHREVKKAKKGNDVCNEQHLEFAEEWNVVKED